MKFWTFIVGSFLSAFIGITDSQRDVNLFNVTSSEPVNTNFESSGPNFRPTVVRRSRGLFDEFSFRSQSSATQQSCANPFNSVFFNLAHNSEAASTGRVLIHGFSFGQDFSDFCFQRAFHKYRTFDGTCNHPRNFGSSFTSVGRLLPPDYDDGLKTPRIRASDGNPLPSARLVSRVAHPAQPDRKDCTIMVMQWGQWLDHDITGFPVPTEEDKTIRCCGEGGGSPPFITPESCFPIELDTGEPNFKGKCMEFVRSVPAKDHKGNEKIPREQINSLTSFIDGSQIYGSTDERASLLRGDGGLLRQGRTDFLPKNEEEDCILRKNSDDYCFLSGDIRVNEQPGLASMHTIWFREHNRIARRLRYLKPYETSEEIFQLTRKIVGALQQVITYNEWLPIILGSTVQRMRLKSTSGRSAYSPGVDPRILNVFSTAAMRFGHSLIPSSFPIGGRNVRLRELFNRPAEVFDNLDALLAGLSGVGSPGRGNLQKVDRNFVKEITNFLFEPEVNGRGRGLDLVALNIQRGRDHGIPPYTKWRSFCGLRPLKGFDDTEALGPSCNELASVYSSVDDIDLFTGLMYEPVDRYTGGIVGPTLNCLLGIQFSNLKFGDRFFFDNDETKVGFTDAQLEALRKVKLSTVICENTRLDKIPLNAFKFSSYSNPLQRCRDLKQDGLNLRLFI